MSLRLGYNTNGFAHHRLTDAIDILAEIGYRCVAITLDHHALDPFDANWRAEASRIRDVLQSQKMNCVIETGSRYLLDPRRKHWPTLISRDAADRERRLDFLRRSIDVARVLDAECVSFWSGANHDELPDEQAMTLLTDGCREIANYAAKHETRLAFEPEPGMCVETMDAFVALNDAVNHPMFGLTLDVGHLHCMGDGHPADRILEFSDRLFNIHIEDMRRSVHEHLEFGQGEMDIARIMRALDEINYVGPVNVELSRHSHDAVNTARRAFKFLAKWP